MNEEGGWSVRRILVVFLVALAALTACKTGTPVPTEPPSVVPTPISPISPISPLPSESPLAVPEAPERTWAALLVIAPSDFNDTEYSEPRAIFEEAGYAVQVASLSMEVARGMHGTEVQPDLALSDVDVANYDTVVFVGGSGSVALWDDEEVHRVAREAVEQGRVLAAICLAPMALARAGVLEGREVTMFDAEDYRPELEAQGAICTGEVVERDGRIVTASGPQAADQFAETIVEVLQE
ncbi:MAG: DJ-1/PfpI family protein [Anaerolineae bacterium]|jgi:protease I